MISRPPDQDPWRLTATDLDAGCGYLANGYLGAMVSADGGLVSGDSGAWHMRGLYVVGPPYDVDRLAVLPAWTIQLASDARIATYRRTLDLRHGLLTTEMLLEEERGRLWVEQTMFASRADRHRVVTRLRLRPEFDGPLACRVRLGGAPDTDAPMRVGSRGERAVLLRGKTRTYGIEVAACVRWLEARWSGAMEANDGGMTYVASTEVSAGKEVTLTQVVGVASGLECDTPVEVAAAPPDAYGPMLAAHADAWERLWETDIEIEGDPEVQQFARAALVSLWSTVWPDDRWSIAPMGLSSNGYNGHIFWDAEFWMYPPLLLTRPALARSCLAYREWTAAAARDRAAADGMRGVRYPWEAGYTGVEMTPGWADTGDFQLHITADVAIAQWWYYLNSGDVAWLRAHGYPIIRACAEYWAGRVEWRPGRDRYEISDVVCADEYAAHVNNDAFTNAAARATLRIATRASALVGEAAPAEWEHIAEKIYIPYDEQHGRHLEYDGYDGRVTKQADVELLTFPLEAVTDPRQIARDLDFYAGVIDPDGPAMSFSVYAILSAQLGRGMDALTYLRRSFRPNTRPPFWLFSETPTNDEFHFCTGVGGALQALLFGFSGIRLREGYVVIDPLLPPGWSRLRLRGLWLLGARTDLDLRPEGFTLRRHLEAQVVELRARYRQGGSALELSASAEDSAPLQLLLPGASTGGRTQRDGGVTLVLGDGGEQRVRAVLPNGDLGFDVCLRGRGERR